jgi:glycosyltransferase involved in cell wall biosynthesis
MYAPDEPFTVQFEAGTLLPVDERFDPQGGTQGWVRPLKVGWLVQPLDVGSASMRYRCFHFARVLGPEFKSLYFTSQSELQHAMPGLDAVVVVKRLGRTMLDLVRSATMLKLPVFLDLCDDLISDSYAKNDHGVNLLHFLGVAPFLAGITVPSAEMAERVEGYAGTHGLSGLSIHVVPDIAETWDIYRATAEVIGGQELPVEAGLDEERTGRSLRQVVWYGNFGASHSNFGIFSLRQTLKALKTVHQEIPLELVVVSNKESVFRAMVHQCGFPTRYVPWSAEAVYSVLGSADAALLTTGDDDFCSIKSSNRVLQALAMNVPVITKKSASVSEFEDAIFSGKLEDSLRLCLGPARSRAVPPRLEAARRVLSRYAPERLAGIWASLIKRAVEKSRANRARSDRGKMLFVLESGDFAVKARELLTAARKAPGLKFDLLVSTDLLENQPEFDAVLARAAVMPRFYSGSLKGGRNLLIGVSAVVVQNKAAPEAKLLAGLAAQTGTPVISVDEVKVRGLRHFARATEPASAGLSTISAGPFDEWSNDDNSVDWSFIVHQNARGWILDAICREIGSRQPNSWKVSYYPGPSPEARNYFFSHYLLLQNYLEHQPEALENKNVFVWYTHPREETPVNVAKLLVAFDDVSKVIFACESNRQIWLDRGLPEEKTAVVLGAADPKLFRYHRRGGGAVGLASSFYERKNPDALLQIMKLLPNRQFKLLGRKWNQYALFEEMKALPNFAYCNVPYREYPAIYDGIDVFLSMSNLEGGPIPLVEAMMSNAVPVASRTGFAPDLIDEGENGFIFDVDASPEHIVELIEAAFKLERNVRETIEQLDWDHFSEAIVNMAR